MTAFSSDDQDNNKNRPESLAERSARLEAEALQGYASAADEYESTGESSGEENAAYAQSAEGAQTENFDNAEFAAVVDTLKNELNDTREQMMRALADAENTRRRAQKDREDASKFAISGFARDLLSVADNLRRAIDAIPADLIESDPRAKNLMDGIEATERELLRSFEKNGIHKLEPIGEAFNPNFHEVMFEAPGTGQPAGTIIQIIETGYILNERLLRPARVGVAKDDAQGSGHTIDTEA